MDIRDVAKSLKISVATVSRALNSSTAHLVSEKTRRRIMEYVKEIGYIPDRAARALSTGRTQTLGLVLPNVLQSIFFNDYLIKVLAGVFTYLENNSRYTCQVIILPRGEVISQLNKEVFSAGLDGLLLSPYCDPALHGDNFPKTLLAKWKKPIVVLNWNTEEIKRFNCVYSDHREAAKKAVAYLIQKGHRKIAMIRGISINPEGNQRIEGYDQALSDHGLKLQKKWVLEGNFQMESGYEATLKLFKLSGPKPTALFCANDEMAIGALRALRALRISCPKDVAVLGFDGIEQGMFTEPQLTSMAQPTWDIANLATRILIDLLEDRVKGPVVQAVPSHLIIRESA